MPDVMDKVRKYLEARLGIRRFRLLLCLILIAAGMSKKRLTGEYGYCYATLNKYIRAIDDGNIDSLFEDNVYRHESELESFREVIEKDFDELPPKNNREAAARIEVLTGIKRSVFRVGRFLKKGASNL
jgi:hypothetical protein